MSVETTDEEDSRKKLKLIVEKEKPSLNRSTAFNGEAEYNALMSPEVSVSKSIENLAINNYESGLSLTNEQESNQSQSSSFSKEVIVDI